MAHQIAIGGHASGLAATTRKDRWWVGPLLTFMGLSGFIIYTTWAAFQGDHYFYGSYLSPLYSPVLFVEPSAAGAAPLSAVPSVPGGVDAPASDPSLASRPPTRSTRNR